MAAARGVILAGGSATRYDRRPKGLERVGGERIIDRLAAMLRVTLGRPPLLVANDPAAGDWETGLEIVPDVMPGAGALGGLLTAVTLGPAPVVCVAWDMPFVPGTLVEALAGELRTRDAALPASPGRRGVEPLCAAYGPACGPPIAAALARGDRRAVAFHDAVNVGILPLARVAGHGDPALLFFNVNTPHDLALAERLWRQRVSSR